MLNDGQIKPEQLTLSMFLLVFSIFGFTGISFVLPNKNEAFEILAKICTILDTKSKANADDVSGEAPVNF